MKARLAALVLLAMTAGPIAAEAPTLSVRPLPRPSQTETVNPLANPPAIRPPAVRPMARPDQTAEPTQPAQPAQPKASRKGSVCRNNAIKGTELAAITARTKGCGIKDPVQVASVNGVRLNPPATINCDAAAALATWIDDGLQPAFGNQVVQLNVAASYVCRTRNNVRGARVSEHGLGNAIDISAVVLSSGKVVTVAANFGKQMRRAHKAACGPFRTTLGPGSDGYHEDHMHFDVSRRGGSAYCR